MPGSAEFHHKEAQRCAAEAEATANRAEEHIDRYGADWALMMAGSAQARATLALTHCAAEQTAALLTVESRLESIERTLGDLLGDDSKLDGLQVTLRDISNGFAGGQP